MKERIDHMTYLPGMEDIGSELMDQVLSAAEAFDYEAFTGADVRRALDKAALKPEDFAALLSPAAMPYLEEMAKRAQLETAGISAIPSTCLHRCILRTIARITAFTAALTAAIKSTARG